ncbi:MAG: TldD/PmbA family protein [Pseudomonadota bacterium]|nr:TldD/PmbA family protein [Pseudomonadota bacterium]
MTPQTPDTLNILDDLVAAARRAGADSVDAVLYNSVSLSLSLRLGKMEGLERSESGDISLRVLVGQRQATVSSSDRTPDALRALVDRAMAMARVVPEDPFAGLAPPDLLARSFPDLDLEDPVEPSPDLLTEQARIAEDAARTVPGVTNSGGAEAGWTRGDMALVTSGGFSGRFASTGHSLSVSVLAGTGTAMERDYDYTAAAWRENLLPADTVGKNAGERAVRSLNPRKVASQKVPVVFEPRQARGLLGHLAAAISGPAIARGTSFLKNSLNHPVFSDSISIVDDPFVRRGYRSRPFDGEGVAPAKRTIIGNGRLTTWLLDCRSARQLGLVSTGHSTRGSVSPSNLFMAPGRKSPEELIRDIPAGLYITEMLGSSVNLVTGDYSRGASGFWIENGTIAWPVSGITVAGHLSDMFRTLEPASDLVLRYGVDAPTVRVDGLTVAGT